MTRTKRPINEQSIVIYHDGGYSHLFRKYVSLFDIRDACERKDCQNTDEHFTFDGQIFYRKKNGD